MNIPIQQLDIRVNDYGKPFIPDSTLHFSLSHSKKLWCIGICNERELGVDIEELNVNIEYNEIAQNYFSNDEQKAVNQSLNPLNEFYKLWTRKEAVLKATGIGLNTDLCQIEVLGNKCTINQNPIINKTYAIESIKVDNAFISFASPYFERIIEKKVTPQNYYSFFF